MVKCLVTGGAGFIGSALVQRLVSDGSDVTVLDNFSTGKRERLAALEGRIALVEGDMRDRAVAERAVAGAEVVFHQAALPSVARSVQDPMTTTDVNVTGTVRILEAARRAGVRRIVYAASSSAYGDTPTLPKREEMRPDPRSPYAASKLAGEHYMAVYARVYGLGTVSLRYFNVFGPRQDPDSQYAAVIPRFIAAALAGEPATVYGDGLQSRDFTYVDNVVEANLRAAEFSGAAGQVCNVACGERCSLLDLLRMVAEILGRSEPIPARFEEPWPGDVRHSLADIGRARDLLGYRPSIGIREGLRRTVAWYEEQARERALPPPGG